MALKIVMLLFVERIVPTAIYTTAFPLNINLVISDSNKLLSAFSFSSSSSLHDRRIVTLWLGAAGNFGLP